MNKELSVFKSTILLYIVVLILPLGFYFVYDSFKTIQKDTQTISQLARITTDINSIALDINNPNNTSTIKEIDNNLYNIATWVNANNKKGFYIGASNLKDDFDKVKSCWDKCKQQYLANDKTNLKKSVIKSNNMLKNFSIVVEKMIYLKQDKIINIFYISLMVIIILMLLSIYLIRLYIEYQINHDSIYDIETNLYNHNYLMEHLKTTCARATRYKYPLSLLSISLKNIALDKLSEDEYKRFMETVGDMVLSLTRTSDVACRYDKTHIAIILPFTEDENAKILMSRIQETFEKQNFDISQDVKFRFSILEYEHSGLPHDYIKKAEKLLHG